MRSRITAFAAVVVLIFVIPAAAQIDTAILRPVGYHPGNIAYFNTPYMANALYHGGEWYSFSEFDFGSPIEFNTSQFENGYPKFLNSGQKLRAPLFGLNINNPFRPAGWPPRDTLTKGLIAVTWKGNADIRLPNATFVSAGSSGDVTGTLLNGRRMYTTTGPNQGTQTLEVHAIAAPLTEIRVWLPAVDNPSTTAKENETGTLEGQLFHPLFLQRIADADWGFIRFMDMGATNASPQQDWIDRRLPAHVFMNGIINSRQPSATAEGNRETGMAYEHMVALCNLTGRNMWINVPHLATADYMTRLAKLIRFGSDGVNPYDAPDPNPVFPPLRSDLKVFIEYSNEIWSSGFSFPQGNFAEEQAIAAGLTADTEGKARFNARKFCDVFSIFQQVFGGTVRLVRVAAIFTALDAYSRPFLQEMATYGPTLSPAVRPDVLAVTTYFGNGIQDFVHQQGFTTGKLFDDPYWASPLFESHVQIAFDEWKRRVLGGDSASGSGPDATGIGGGFSSSLRTLPNETLGFPLPIIAYEGGPSLFTDTIDQNATNEAGVPTDDGVTTFVEAMNRDPRIADVYRIHLDIARSKALWTHTPYLDTSIWSRFGQWGHLENLDQPPATAPKYTLMLEHFATYTSLRHVDAPLGAIPQFTTSGLLAVGIAGQSYSTDIVTSGGDGTRTATLIGSFLDPGLSVTAPSAGTLRVSGIPTTSRKNFLLVRVTDGDGDPAWRVFTLETFGGPGTLVQSDFRGTSPGLSLPYTATFVLSSKVTFSGWDVGRAQSGSAGVTPKSGDNALVFSVNGPSGEDSTLSEAIADEEYLKATVTPTAPLDLREGQIRFSTKRIGFHSPTGYALFTSIGGFSAANALHVSTVVPKDNFDEVEHVVTLPATTAFSSLNSPIEIRIYAFGARFDGHNTSLSGFKLSEKTSVIILSIANDSLLPDGRVGLAYSTTLNANGGTAPYTFSLGSGTLPAGLSLSASGVLSGTPAAAGTSNFVVNVADATSGTASKAFTLNIAASTVVAGDVDGDGIVTSADLNLVQETFQTARGAVTSSTSSSDCNADGQITAADVLCVFAILHPQAPGLVQTSLKDVDRNGSSQPLADGLLILRRLFGFGGATLISGAVGGGAVRSSSAEIQTYVDSLRRSFDIDRNGTTDALTDGLLLLRFLFGFRGATLVNGAVAPGATRADATAIAAYLSDL